MSIDLLVFGVKTQEFPVIPNRLDKNAFHHIIVFLGLIFLQLYCGLCQNVQSRLSTRVAKYCTKKFGFLVFVIGDGARGFCGGCSPEPQP